MSKKSRRPRARCHRDGQRPDCEGLALFAAAARRSACEECGHVFAAGEAKKLAIFGDPVSLRVLGATVLCAACGLQRGPESEEAGRSPRPIPGH